MSGYGYEWGEWECPPGCDCASCDAIYRMGRVPMVYFLLRGRWYKVISVNRSPDGELITNTDKGRTFVADWSNKVYSPELGKLSLSEGFDVLSAAYKYIDGDDYAAIIGRLAKTPSYGPCFRNIRPPYGRRNLYRSFAQVKAVYRGKGRA